MISSNQGMAEAARLDLQSHGVEVSRETAWQALDAALAIAGQPADGMSRAEAVALAVSTTDHLSQAPTNSKGYTVDGWRAPVLRERVQAIQAITATLLGETTDVPERGWAE